MSAKPADEGFSRAYIEARTSPSQRRASPADAFELARQRYLTGHRLDMRELARTLGVSRTTLYRWCGDREDLLTDVIWSVTQDGIQSFRAASPEIHGREALRHGIRLFLEHSVRDPALRAFIDNEGHDALRIMTASRNGHSHHDRLVSYLAQRIEDESQHGDLLLRAPANLVAYTIVRVMAGFVYNDAIAAIDPQIDKAMEVLDYLLTEPVVVERVP